MLNPHSATSRIKNQLAYKLGSCVIEHNANGGGGYLSLIYKLYKIKKENFKEKKLYKQTIKIFPNLIYPDIKTLNDYNDSIRIKFHLSYMLGQTLIQADKNKFKGGYFALFKDIKQTKKDYKIIKTLLSDFNVVSPSMCNAIADNKKIFIKNLNKINNIIQTHKNYQAIIDNIFHNFDYVLKHLDLIQEWLLSDDFYQKYKKENHPYPSLLDPKKLNDENEEINYNNISAELAWEMNLPLPENYGFVFLVIHGAGTSAATYYFRLCQVTLNRHYGDPLYQFLDSYKMLVNNKNTFNAIILAGRDYGHKKEIAKFYSLIQKIVPAVCFIRDPISVLKPILNHFGRLDFSIIKKEIPVFFPYDKLLNIKIDYCYKDKDGNPNIEILDAYSRDYDNYNILNERIKKIKISKIYYITMDEILPNRAFDTFESLSNKLNFFSPNKKDKNNFLNFSNASNDHADHYFFPKEFYYILENQHKIVFYVEKDYSRKNYINCIEEFLDTSFFLDKRISVNIQEEELNFLRKNKKLWEDIVQYFKEYFILLEKFYINERIKLKVEKDILLYLKNNSDVLLRYKNKFDEDLEHVKQHRPDIVASWRYYQEFEKMCEELDGKDKIEQE
ncbi:DUF2972 domain-containing protein [Campylobacter volucris]|uniref:DUF2972 domain-containing protein n=1 Tax=Campylobacter volucris TaxID=1031542 RepID=A0A5C7E298_9BACT|nr:DUF2972 domain-containing protein [Campylobacter volucris]TXE88341.1 DUF2972 domain-containing protein [Campylobacter volucris]